MILCFLFFLDPRFISIHLIPESDNPEDDKLFLFFKENAMDGEHAGKATIARIGQLCKVTTRKQKICWKKTDFREIGYEFNCAAESIRRWELT